MTPLEDGAGARVTLTHEVYTPAAIEQTISRISSDSARSKLNWAGTSTHLRFHLKPDSPGSGARRLSELRS